MPKRAEPQAVRHSVGVKEAVAAAVAFARTLYADEDLRHLRLEEVEPSADERYWNVTLGWLESATTTQTNAWALTQPNISTLPRVYKVFRVDDESGKVESMKMRGSK